MDFCCPSEQSVSQWASRDIAIIDILQRVIEQEQKTYRCQANSLLGRVVDTNDEPYSEHLRVKICDWAFGAIDNLRLSREMAAVAVSLIDRFLVAELSSDEYSHGNLTTTTAHQIIVNGRMVQLAAIAAMYISIKLHDLSNDALQISYMCEMGRWNFTPGDIERMEWKILMTLKWRVHPPTAISFVEHFSQLLPELLSPPQQEEDDDIVAQELYTASVYLAELSVFDMFAGRPSDVALAAVLLAVHLLPTEHSVAIVTTSGLLSRFEHAVQTWLGLSADSPQVREAYQRLYQSYAHATSSSADPCLEEHLEEEEQSSLADQKMPLSKPSSTSSDTASGGQLSNMHASPSTAVIVIEDEVEEGGSQDHYTNVPSLPAKQ